MQIKVKNHEFVLTANGREILFHSKERPMIYVGVGKEDVDMYRGNFKISDYVTERYPLALTKTEETPDGVRLNFEDRIEVDAEYKNDVCVLSFNLDSRKRDDEISSLMFRIP